MERGGHIVASTFPLKLIKTFDCNNLQKGLQGWTQKEKSFIPCSAMLEINEKQVELQTTIVRELDAVWNIVRGCQTKIPEADGELAGKYDQILRLLGYVMVLLEDSIKGNQEAATNHRKVIFNLEAYIADVRFGCED